MLRRLVLTLNVTLTLVLLTGCWPDPPDPIPPLHPEAVPPETLSVDYPNADIRELLEALAPYFHLKLDLPNDLRGRTSIKLREVTWRQIFAVTLSPIDYDFYEANDTVFVRTKEEIAALPPVSTTITLQHQAPHATTAYLNRRFRGRITFTPIHHGVAYTVSRKMQKEVETEIRRIDSPDTILNRFPKKPLLPKELPPLKLAPLQPWEIGSETRHAVTTQIFIFNHIDAELAAPYIEKAAADKYARAVVDIRVNALIVTAPESRMRTLEAIVAYLDDSRWYEPESVAPPR